MRSSSCAIRCSPRDSSPACRCRVCSCNISSYGAASRDALVVDGGLRQHPGATAHQTPLDRWRTHQCHRCHQCQRLTVLQREAQPRVGALLPRLASFGWPTHCRRLDPFLDRSSRLRRRELGGAPARGGCSHEENVNAIATEQIATFLHHLKGRWPAAQVHRAASPLIYPSTPRPPPVRPASPASHPAEVRSDRPPPADTDRAARRGGHKQ